MGVRGTQCDAWGPPPSPWTGRQIRRRLRSTEATWRSWSRLHQRYDGPWRDLVHHCGVVLRGWTHVHSGAVIAAPTTSLPEGIGSGRTWDYRFTRVRDASMTMQGPFIAACPDEAGPVLRVPGRAAATQLDRGGEEQRVPQVGVADHAPAWMAPNTPAATSPAGTTSPVTLLPLLRIHPSSSTTTTLRYRATPGGDPDRSGIPSGTVEHPSSLAVRGLAAADRLPFVEAGANWLRSRAPTSVT